MGMDTYTVSAAVRPNLSASIRPGTAIFPWVHLTAFGSPLLPDVKISMSRSSAVLGLHQARGASRRRTAAELEPVLLMIAGRAGSGRWGSHPDRSDK
jgi:hypothetical protein